MDREQPPWRQATEELFLENAQAQMQLLYQHWKNTPVTYSAQQLRQRLQFVFYGSARGVPRSPAGTPYYDAHVEAILALLLDGRSHCDVLEVLVCCRDQETTRCGHFYVIRYDRGFVDQFGRHYTRWSDWQRHNPMPAHVHLCFPRDGQYVTDADGKVLVELAAGNASHIMDNAARLLSLETSALALVCALVPINEIFLPFLDVADRVAGLVAAFLTLRDIGHLLDRYRHRLDLSPRHARQRACWLRVVLSVCGLLAVLPIRITRDFVHAGLDPPPCVAITAVALSFGLLAAAAARCLDLTAQLLLQHGPHGGGGRWLELGQLAVSLVVLARGWRQWLAVQALALEALAFAFGWHPPVGTLAGMALGADERFPREVPAPRSGSIFFAEAAAVESFEDALSVRIQREFYAQAHADNAQRLASMQDLYEAQSKAVETAAKFAWFEFETLPLLGDPPLDDRAPFLSADRLDAASTADMDWFLARERS